MGVNPRYISVQTLMHKLKSADSSEKTRLLQDAYRQLIKETKGEFRDFVENDSFNGHELAWGVAGELDKNGLADQAKKLRREYSGIPDPSERSWTKAPNLWGNSETTELLVSLGDEGRDLAALGAIGAALEHARRAEMQPADPKFLYPKSNQFPFDEVTAQIVRALQKNPSGIPGIEVKFHSYGPSSSYRRVDTIEGEDFRLWFCRTQGIAGDFNDNAAVSTINIPKKELDVFDDNSGPVFYLYVGKNWEANRKQFVDGIKVNSKLDKNPRTYLKYHGSWQKSDGGVSYPGKVAPFLAHTNDLGREYEPEGNEPKYFETEKVFQEFTEFLQKKLEEINQTLQ